MSDPLTAALVARRLAVVRERIASAGGDPALVTVVAVTKGFGPAAVAAARDAGLGDVGENYAGELLGKVTAQELRPGGAAQELRPGGAAQELRPGGTAQELRPGGTAQELRWHFLGAVQRNKVARLAPYVSLWQGVDRVGEAAAIARHAPGASVLVEVDASGLSGRGGVPPERVATTVSTITALGLVVRGLMTIAPPDSSGAARAFDGVGRLVSELGLEVASMGMSDDLELAVAHGSTMVRVGRSLFGPRPTGEGMSQ